MSISLAFPDSTYTTSNKPSVATLKNDLSAIEADVNAHEADATIHFTLQSVYPVGSIYTNKTNSTNPATLFGFGTWVAITGRVVVGLDATQTEFDTAGEEGGEKTHTLTEAELAVHTHIQNAHTHTVSGAGGGNGYPGNFAFGASTTFNTGSTTAVNQNAGSGAAHNNLQPYVVCYVWERTA